jgi:hypothetical protein
MSSLSHSKRTPINRAKTKTIFSNFNSSHAGSLVNYEKLNAVKMICSSYGLVNEGEKLNNGLSSTLTFSLVIERNFN